MAITDAISNITGVDLIAIVMYFAIVIGFGIWSSLKNRGSVGGYFLAGRSMHCILVGASLFSSNIGSGHFIGLAGSGASTGIALVSFEFNAMLVLIILGWIFLPVYISSGVYTMPEYICKRFGGQRIRIYLAVLALLLSIFTKIAADLYAGALFINQAVGWNIYMAILLLLTIAALFTITGGLTAVMWTDFIQTIIMIVGAVYLMIVSFINVGGYLQMKERFLVAAEPINVTDPNTNTVTLALPTNSTCAYPPANSFHLFRPVDDEVLPWPGYLGILISSVWYWCSDQVIVQRALASKNYSHAKAGCLVAGYLKFLPLWLIVFPGMISRILYPEIVACSDPDRCNDICGSTAGCTNLAYPILVLRLMPIGARGLMLAVMMSALMSSLSSVFNSSSTIFTMDIWVKIRKQCSDTELMIVGRVFVLVMVGFAIAWIPIVQNFAELFNYIQSVTSYLAPPICAVYILAILWGRINEHGAFWGLMVGLVVGLTRFIWENIYKKVACGSSESDPRHFLIKDVHYLHFGVILFVMSTLVIIGVSLVTKPIDEKHLVRLLFWNRHSTEERIDLNEEEENKKKARKESTSQNSEITTTSSDASMAMQIQDPPAVEAAWWRRAARWICGIEKEIHLSEEEKAAMEKEHTSLEEEKTLFWAGNIGAVLLAIFAVVVLVYFG